MQRFVFYSPSLDRKALLAAKRTASRLGATVVRSLAGSMLLEAPRAKAAEVAEALPGWQCSAEKKVHRIPERTPLDRARVKKAA
jgi:hypothetical protein